MGETYMKGIKERRKAREKNEKEKELSEKLKQSVTEINGRAKEKNKCICFVFAFIKNVKGGL